MSAQSKGRWLIFGYLIIVLAVLLLVALVYANNGFNSILPAIVPRAGLAAAWAGALGGTAISFKGVFDHKSKPDPSDPVENVPWDNELLPWHLGRPFSGLIVGIFVFIALKAVYPSGDPSAATLAAASFVLGTQERGFFNFVKQIGAVVVSVPRNNGDKENTSIKKK